MQLTLLRRSHLAGNAWSYEFTPSRPLAWQAGQFMRVEIPHPHPDAEGTKRYFTIAAGPSEGLVRIATRLTDSTFKQALHALEPGDTIKLLDEPFDDFVWEDHPRPLLLVAQGIGITPFYAMLSERAARGLPLTAHLVYSNIAPGVVFQSQLEAMQEQGLSLTLLNKPVTAGMLAELIPDLTSRLVYISGPKSLVTLLGPPHNLPPDQLKQDVFPNYPASSY
jgi:ferredoxin-NADP reductase